MKKVNLALGLMLSVGSFVGCRGDHYANNGRDTEQNSYHVTPDSSKLDTFKVAQGDATMEDNSASGGTRIKKGVPLTVADTTKKD